MRPLHSPSPLTISSPSPSSAAWNSATPTTPAPPAPPKTKHHPADLSPPPPNAPPPKASLATTSPLCVDFDKVSPAH